MEESIKMKDVSDVKPVLFTNELAGVNFSLHLYPQDDYFGQTSGLRCLNFLAYFLVLKLCLICRNYSSLCFPTSESGKSELWIGNIQGVFFNWPPLNLLSVGQ